MEWLAVAFVISMVLESVAEIVLSRFLDKFFYGISKKNIQFALL